MPDATSVIETPVTGQQTAVLVLDPFTMVYDALWNLLESHHGLTSLVGISNRIRFHSTRAEIVDAEAAVDSDGIAHSGDNTDPIKANVVPSDLPELDIRPAGGSFAPWATSSSAHATQLFMVGITTGDLRIAQKLFPVKWALFRALMRARHDLQLDFVNQVAIDGVDETLGLEEQERGTIGWVALIMISVRMSFDRETMERDETGAI